MDYADSLRTLVASLGYAVTAGIVAGLIFLALVGAVALLAWRAPKSTHRWPK
jgi:hypothetical protein